MKKQLLIPASVLAIATGFSLFVAFTKPAQSKLTPTQITDAEEADDDEPLSTNGCGGVERWAVKVMTDTAAYRLDLTPKMTSITHLTSLTEPMPTSSMPRYNPTEDSVYTVICTITTRVNESDSDVHMVISDGGVNTMIAESPDPNCSSVAASPYIKNFIQVRKWVDSVMGTATNWTENVTNVEITGQAFLDPPHGQTGVSPNNMELHSILKIGFHTTVGTGTGAIAASEGLRIYPNPSNGLYNVSMPAAKGNEIVTVYNTLGEEVYQGPITSNSAQINITGSSAGVYIYKIMSVEGEFISSGKLLLLK